MTKRSRASDRTISLFTGKADEEDAMRGRDGTLGEYVRPVRRPKGQHRDEGFRYRPGPGPGSGLKDTNGKPR